MSVCAAAVRRDHLKTDTVEKPNPNGDNEIAIVAWLGAVLDRLNRGICPPISLDDAELTVDIRSFGAGKLRCASLNTNVMNWLPNNHSATDEILSQIHQKCAGTQWEDEFWAQMISQIPFTLPFEAAADLIDRNIAIEWVGHSMLVDELLWRLVDRVDEALLTLAKRRYVNAVYSADEFEEVLNAFPDHEWMLGSLPSLTASSDEKIPRLIATIRKHQNAEKLAKHQSPAFAALWTASPNVR